MSIHRFLSRSSNRGSGADRNSFQSDSPPPYTVDGTPTATGNVPGSSIMSLADSGIAHDETKLTPAESGTVHSETSLSPADVGRVAETSAEAGPRYLYYRIYSEDGAICSKKPATPENPFLGRMKAKSVAPPHTVASVKRCIANFEGINLNENTLTSLFVAPYSESPMGNADKVSILNRNGLGSMPKESLALVAELSLEEREVLESDGRGEHVNAPSGVQSREGEAVSTVVKATTRYLYYQLYTECGELPSKMCIDKGEPSLGRVSIESIAPPHTPASIKRCISRVERIPELASANLFEGISFDSPMTEGHISLESGDGPGMTPDEPVALVAVGQILARMIRAPSGDGPGTTPDEPVALVTVGQILTRMIRAKSTTNYSDPKWLSVTKGEVLHTDGIDRKKSYLGELKLLCQMTQTGLVFFREGLIQCIPRKKFHGENRLYTIPLRRVLLNALRQDDRL